MDASSAWARVRPLLARIDGSPAEIAALAALAAGALALLGALWLRTPAGEPVARTDPVVGEQVGSGPVASGGSAETGGGIAPTADEVVVHVAGAVAAPGMYELPGGARLADAVEAAGGATGDAVLDHVNLAREVNDGEHVLVPDQASLEASEGARRPDGRIDVNRASATELEELPGVGPVTAQRIIEHREANGPFADPRDLIAVPGIGERTLEALADDIGV